MIAPAEIRRELEALELDDLHGPGAAGMEISSRVTHAASRWHGFALLADSRLSDMKVTPEADDGSRGPPKAFRSAFPMEAGEVVEISRRGLGRPGSCQQRVNLAGGSHPLSSHRTYVRT